MKRFFLLALCTMILYTFSACSPVGETVATISPEPAASVSDEDDYSVSTAEELLGALGSNRTILLAPGTYDLSAARGYALAREGAPYTWENVGDGYQLTLWEVENLTLLGAGAGDTTIVTAPRNAAVLQLEGCRNICLEGITLGHTQEPQPCSAGVILARDTAGLTLSRLGLYGCGSVGLQLEGCREVRISDSDIYDCSSSAFTCYAETTDVLLENLRIDRIGGAMEPGYAVFSVSSGCREIRVKDTVVRECNVQNLVYEYDAQGVVLENVTFRENRATMAALEIHEGELTLAGCSFLDNAIRSWYPVHGYMAQDETGEYLAEETLQERFGEKAPAQLPEQLVKYAATVDELLAAIGPDTKILLTGESYDLTTAANYEVFAGNDYYTWEQGSDGLYLVIWGVENMTIASETGEKDGCQIVTQPRCVDVLTFLRCTDITVSGITIGHTEAAGPCEGGVVTLRDCDRITLESCGLFGCGILGLNAYTCGDLTIRDCEIYECSTGGILLQSVIGCRIENCTFRDLGGQEIAFWDCREIYRDGEELRPEDMVGN